MTALFFIALALILEPLLEKVYQHLFLFQPVHFKLTAGKSYHAFTAQERITLFHHKRQTIFLALGMVLLLILTGKEIFEAENWLDKICFLGSLSCILIPLCEIGYYRWSINRYWKEDMTAKEMSDYHDFCQRYYRHSFSLNGTGRQRLRFVLLTIGVCTLISLSLFIFKF